MLPADFEDGSIHPQIDAAGAPEPGQHGRSALPISSGALERAIANNTTVGHILNNRPIVFVWLCRRGILTHDILGFKAGNVWAMVNPQGYTTLRWGSASGANRAAIAARKALCIPLLQVRRLQEASRVLIAIAASRQTLRLSECTSILRYFRNDRVPGAFYLFGATRELDGSDERKVSVLATGRQLARY